MTRKKLLLTAAVMLISILLSGCGSKLNDNNNRAAKSIINTVDSYLDGEIDAGTAHDLVYVEYEAIDESDENSADRLVFSTNALLLSTELSSMAFNNGGDVSEIKERRNEIAELIGESKYK